MIQTSKSSIVFNEPNKIIGLQPFIYRCRNCDTNLNGNTPADQYQKLKLIQNTVRVYASLYTANLGPLSAYKKPTAQTYGVCWNQMSDRPVPSVQRATIPTGFGTSLNRKHTSVTSSRPGCQTPGGVGCDIKHNSYDRYLNRLKGKGPMRRGVVPPTFGSPISFNPAFPIYGGKTVKTNIVSSCDCPQEQTLNQDIKLYNDPLWQPYPNVNFEFKVGQNVYAIKTGTNYYSVATITSIVNDVYTIQFEDETIQTTNVDELKYYYPCNCNSSYSPSSLGVFSVYSSDYGVNCSIPLEEFLGNSIL